jgi:hypothetical protein
MGVSNFSPPPIVSIRVINIILVEIELVDFFSMQNNSVLIELNIKKMNKKSITLWDGNVYCVDCVKSVSQDLFLYASKNSILFSRFLYTDWFYESIKKQQSQLNLSLIFALILSSMTFLAFSSPTIAFGVFVGAFVFTVLYCKTVILLNLIRNIFLPPVYRVQDGFIFTTFYTWEYCFIKEIDLCLPISDVVILKTNFVGNTPKFLIDIFDYSEKKQVNIDFLQELPEKYYYYIDKKDKRRFLDLYVESKYVKIWENYLSLRINSICCPRPRVLSRPEDD